MTYPFPDESFDLVTLVATIHHLQLRPALIRLRKLLKPGGVLAIVGLYRGETLTDLAVAAAAFPVSWISGWSVVMPMKTGESLIVSGLTRGAGKPL